MSTQISIDGSSVIVTDKKMIIDGKETILPEKVKRKSGNTTSIINGSVFINKYEWKNGKFKKTFAAIWNYYF